MRLFLPALNQKIRLLSDAVISGPRHDPLGGHEDLRRIAAGTVMSLRTVTIKKGATPYVRFNVFNAAGKIADVICVFQKDFSQIDAEPVE